MDNVVLHFTNKVAYIVKLELYCASQNNVNRPNEEHCHTNIYRYYSRDSIEVGLSQL